MAICLPVVLDRGRYSLFRTSDPIALSTVFSLSSRFALSAGVSDLRATPCGTGRLCTRKYVLPFLTESVNPMPGVYAQ